MVCHVEGTVWHICKHSRFSWNFFCRCNFTLVLELKTLQFRNKKRKIEPDFLLFSLFAKSICQMLSEENCELFNQMCYCSEFKIFIACHHKLSFHVTMTLFLFKTLNCVLQMCRITFKGDLQTICRFSYMKVFKLITLGTKFKNLLSLGGKITMFSKFITNYIEQGWWLAASH